MKKNEKNLVYVRTKRIYVNTGVRSYEYRLETGSIWPFNSFVG